MKFFYRSIYICTKKFFSLLFRHQVYGKHHLPAGPCILAPNHASFLDPPLVAISCDEEVNFLARGSLFNNAIFKKLISHLNSYPVGGISQDITSLKLILQLLKDSKKVVIFPEGKRTPTGHLLPIKPGIGMLISKSQCPIIPVYIHGTYEAWPKKKWIPRLEGQTACVFGKPIYWEAYKDLPKKKAQEEISNAIQKSLKMLNFWYLNGAQGEPP